MFKGLYFFIKFSWGVNKRYLIYNILRQFVSSLIPIVSVAMPKYIIDELLGLKRTKYLLLYVGILVGYNLLASLVSNFLTVSAFQMRIEIASEFNLFMHKKLIEVDYEDLESPDFLDIKEKANKFLYGDWRGFSYVLDSALNIIGQLLTLLGIIAIISSMNKWILLLFFIITLMSSFIESWSKKNQMKLSLEQSKYERGSMYYSKIFEDFSYGKEIRINGLGDWLLGREKKNQKDIVNFYKQMNKFSIKSHSFNSLAIFIQNLITYVYLIIQVVKGTLGIGDFTMYSGAAIAFSGAITQVMSSIVDIKSYGIYYDALEEYLTIESTLRKNRRLPIPNGKHLIEFKNVSFKYKNQKDFILKNINIKIESNKKLSIVGENGAGKTTFIKLLMRIYDPSEGEILLDGINIKDIDYDSYMALFSTVFQDYKLFSFSLKENVALAKSGNVSDTEIEQIIKSVGLGNKLSTLPSGIDTQIYKIFDDKGFEPSGGEGQRIALARAIYKNAPIVILDEPTAALDPRAEYEIYKNFNQLVHGKTALFISHRLSSSKFCDYIAVFQNGEIVEYGIHDELINNNGVYSELYNMQSQFYV